MTTKPSLSLPMTMQAAEPCLELHSALNNAFLATIGKDGIYFWERRAHTRHILTWEQIIECCHQYQGSCQECVNTIQ